MNNRPSNYKPKQKNIERLKRYLETKKKESDSGNSKTGRRED